jgi:Uncharacterised nucleotidyltransferase
MTRPFAPEFELAAACAMWPPSQRRNDAILAAAARPLDWARFLRVARRHRVTGLAHDGLMRAQIDVPPDAAKEIGAQAVSLVQDHLGMAAEALRLQRMFDKAGLPVLFVKGPSLAMLAFGNLSLSGGQDIDLLVPAETLAPAATLVERAGYHRFDPPPDISDAQLRLLMPIRKDFGFAHHLTGLPIELHWRLFLNPHALTESSIVSSSRIVSLSDTLGLRTLGEEDLFAYLCMHGALHWWNRLKWLADINALLAALPEGTLEHLIRAAAARGAARAVAQALLLCQRLLGTPFPDRLMGTFAKSARVRWLEATALKAMTTGQGELEPRNERFGTTRGSLSTFILSQSWRYRLTEVSIHLTNQTDVLTVPLPEWLQFLYPVLRLPLWAWRHRPVRSQTPSMRVQADESEAAAAVRAPLSEIF